MQLDKNQSKIHEHFPSDHFLSKKENVEKVIDWNTFYRRNPHRFAEHYLGLTLHLYQVIILYLMFLSPTFCLVASRAAAKSYVIAIYSCIKSILYPRSQTVVASATKKQARLIVTEKIKKELMGESQNLNREIISIKDNQNDIEVIWKNISSIVVCVASENSRGYRCTDLVSEEFRMIKKDVLDSVLSPFLVTRSCPYLKLSEYSYLVEEPREIYISSSWFTSHWMWELMNTICKDMFQNEGSYILGMDYSITLKHGIKTRKFLIKEKKKLDPMSWAIEYENQMISENTHAYFTFDMLNKNQRLHKAFYPRKNADYISRVKNKHAIPKQEGEIRIISCDIAMVENKNNDNSVFTCIRCLPESREIEIENENKIEISHGYRRLIPYIEIVKEKETSKQAIRIKQLYEDFDADFCVLDLRNSGINIYDCLAKVLYDDERDKEYKPWVCMNDEATAKRINISGAEPVLYAVIASLKLNSDIANNMRNTLIDEKIDLLINLNQAIEELQVKIPEYLNSLDPEVQDFYESPYIATSFLINEMINLDYEKGEQTGYIRIKEQSTMRKDCYTSLSYGDYFISQLERDLFNNNEFDYSYDPICVSEIDF